MKGSMPNLGFGDEAPQGGSGVNLNFDVSAPRQQDLGTNNQNQGGGDLYGGDQGTDDLYGDDN